MPDDVKRQAGLPERVVGRLALYRVLLERLRPGGKEYVFSHELAQLAGVTPSQVRRDLMNVGCTGSPARGYAVEDLVRCIGQMLDAPFLEPVVLVGVGNLGRAVLAFLEHRRPNLRIVAAFDSDPGKVNRIFSNVRCHPVQTLDWVVRQRAVRVGIITVPAQAAQPVADTLVAAGVTGILNFAPVPLQVPPQVFVENVDIGVALEKVAFFARQSVEN